VNKCCGGAVQIIKDKGLRRKVGWVGNHFDRGGMGMINLFVG
jgi:hypothetical protein